MPLLDPWLPDAPVPRARSATPIRVYRYTAGAATPLEPMPHLECLSVEVHEGPAPAVAAFRYNLDYPGDSYPESFEEALSTALAPVLSKQVQPGDRLVVKATRPDGLSAYLFDGVVLDFAFEIDARTEEAPLIAEGIAVHLRDTPIDGALMRDADAPTTVSDQQTDLVAHFNPHGQPNCIPDGAMASNLAGDYPTFLDATCVRNPDVRTAWTLPKAARYLCYTQNSQEDWVKNPAGADLDALLIGRTPIVGTAYDPNDAATYTAQAIAVPDKPITGRDWPSVLHELIVPGGFGLTYDLATAASGLPQTTLRPFLRQAATPKSVWLQPRGARLDVSYTNLGRARLNRDLRELANRWVVEGGLTRHEASFVLAPGYSSAGTADNATLANYDKSSASFKANRDLYRLYVLDETGEGHYAIASATRLTTVPSLDNLLGAPAPDVPGGANVPQYVKRRRKPIGTLLTKDSNGKPLEWRLDYSTDYTGTYPDLWDGTGTWHRINGGIELLKDRLGIWISVDNPNKWSVDGTGSTRKILKGVEDQANNGANKFFLRLTCVVEADKIVSATADRRDASPLVQVITRRLDARDRYRKDTVYYPSEYNPPGGDGVDIVARDDTALCQAEAAARQLATEAGQLTGPVNVPRFTLYYRIGDRIDQIRGRQFTFNTASTSTSDAPIYPCVVAIRWDLQGGQQTTLTLSDARGEGLHANPSGRPSRRARPATRRPPAVPIVPRQPAPANPGSLHEND